MQPPTQDTNETRVVPSPNRETPNDAKALTIARIIYVSNPQAFHHYAEQELSAWIQANLPEELLTPRLTELLKASYDHGKKAFEVQATFDAVNYLEDQGSDDKQARIAVDSFTDRKGIEWQKCEYILQFEPFSGDLTRKTRKVGTKLWFTAQVKASILHDRSVISIAMTETLAKANLLVTMAKEGQNAAGTPSGRYHIDFVLKEPGLGIPWNLFYLTRTVKLPITKESPAEQELTMNLNPVLIQEGNLCPLAYCIGNCAHNRDKQTLGKRKAKEQERLRLTNKYTKGGSSSEYQHPFQRLA